MTSVDLTPKMVNQSGPEPGWLWWIETRTWVVSLLLVVATLALYYPVKQHPFIDYDDNAYIMHVRAGLDLNTVKWAFTTYDEANWHPLTWLSHALDCQLFGVDPAGHHDVNLLWQVVDVVLLFWVLYRATGFAARSFMVAALFALHPINVQTVAWVAERKNLLSMAFFLLALGAYQWYARQPRVSRYAVVALLFALGLMAKPQVITLPCVLLLWDYWPLRRMFAPAPESSSGTALPTIPPKSFSWLLVEKLPLFALAAASAVITMDAQSMGGTRIWYPRLIRLGNAIVSYARYVGKAIWPSRLALFYPHPGYALKTWQVLAALAFLLAVTALVVTQWRRRYLTVGWLWFLGTMVPMIGLIQVGEQAMADRYAYLPFIGLFIMICWGVADWSGQRHISPTGVASVAVAVLVALTVTARVQLNHWTDNVTLWSHTLQVTGPNFKAENNLGVALEINGEPEEAIKHFRAASTIDPDDPASNMNIGIYEQQHGNLSEAIEHYRKVVSSSADASVRSGALKAMGRAYSHLGDMARAHECFTAAESLQFRQ